jgi:hypothetical protein
MALNTALCSIELDYTELAGTAPCCAGAALHCTALHLAVPVLQICGTNLSGKKQTDTLAK